MNSDDESEFQNGGPYPYFTTYVIQFMIKPQFREETSGYYNLGATGMRLWRVIPGHQKSIIEMTAADDVSFSTGDTVSVFNLLRQDISSMQMYPNDPAKHTHKAQKFIRYLLGQMHKVLKGFPGAIPERPPRTFPVYLQWAIPSSVQRTGSASKHFQKIRQAINGAYFADGVRFRLVQDTLPSRDNNHGLGSLERQDGPKIAIHKFVQLVIGEPLRTDMYMDQTVLDDWSTKNWQVQCKTDARGILQYRLEHLKEFTPPVSQKLQIEATTIIVVLLVNSSQSKKLVTYTCRYFRASSDYCPKVHKVIPRTGRNHIALSEDKCDEEIKKTVQPILNREDTPMVLTNNSKKLQELFPTMESSSIKEFGIEDNPQNDTILHDIICIQMHHKQQYGVILDAGSSGTRSFVYEWQLRWDAASKPILPETMKRLWDKDLEKNGVLGDKNWEKNGGIAKLLDGGLQGLKKRVERYLSDLIQHPLKVLVQKGVNGILDKDGNPRTTQANSSIHISQVPLYLMATGGMRELRERDGQGYRHLRDVVVTYLNSTGFLEPTYDTISGEAEGIFAWLDANFEEGTLIRLDGKRKPHGLVEMGGQTVQLAFTRIPKKNGSNPWGDYVGPLIHLDLGSKVQYDVFCKSWGALGSQAMWTEHCTHILGHDDDGAGYRDPSAPTGAKYDFEYSLITGTGSFVDTIRQISELLHCRDTACVAGDLCVSRLKRGCLLNEIEGLEIESKVEMKQDGSMEDEEMKESFIGVSSVTHALRNLKLGIIDDPEKRLPVSAHEIFKEANERYSKTWDTLWKEKFTAKIGEIHSMTSSPETQKNSQQELIHKMTKDENFLLKEMFTAGLTLTMTLVGMGIPMGPYAKGCAQLASIWFRVESQCLDAGVNPTLFLFKRLLVAIPQAFPKHFGNSHRILRNLLDAILEGYLVGGEVYEDNTRVTKDGPLGSRTFYLGEVGRDPKAENLDEEGKNDIMCHIKEARGSFGVVFNIAFKHENEKQYQCAVTIEKPSDQATMQAEDIVTTLIERIKTIEEKGYERGHRIIKKLRDDPKLEGMDESVVPHFKKGLDVLTDEVSKNIHLYKEPYYSTKSGKIGNTAFRDLCFRFFVNCLNWEEDSKEGTRIIPASENASWTRGRMLLHSVGTTPVVMSHEAWKTAYEPGQSFGKGMRSEGGEELEAGGHHRGGHNVGTEEQKA